MGGRSPNYDEKLPKKEAVIERLRAAYGASVAVRVGYAIDPRIGGGRQGIREALNALVNRDRITSLVVVYHGVGFSDIMQTHHLRHLVAAHLKTLGAGELPVRYAEPLGTTDHYVAAVVEKVRAELAQLPPSANVAIHLSGHGLPTTKCGEYDCGGDAYHRYARALFARAKPAIEAAVDRPGRTGVFHIYGDGGEGNSDPDDKVRSPIEALDERVAEGGWTHVVDIPYEFDSNSRDTLIVLRQGYRRPQPDWNERWESYFAYRGLAVKIANANGAESHKTAALEAVTRAALDGLAGPTAAAPIDGEAHHAAAGLASASRAAGGRTGAIAHHHPTGATAAVTATSAATPDGDAHHAPQGGLPRPGRVDANAHPHGNPLAAGASAHTHRTGQASALGGTLLIAAGALGVAGAVAARRRVLVGRVALAGVGAQVIGLGWDVIAHARDGEGVHLLENGGHWTVLVGLLVTAVAAATLVRLPVAGDPSRAAVAATDRADAGGRPG